MASRLALAGAFGYDLLFQFDPIELTLPRNDVKDLRLFFCDDIYFMDRKKEQIERFQYDFSRGEISTDGMARTAERVPRPKKIKDAPDHRRPHAGRVHGEGRKGTRRHAPRRLLRSRAAPDVPRPLFRHRFQPVRENPTSQPQSVPIPAPVWRRATDRRLAGNVRPRRRASRGDLSYRRNRAPHGRPLRDAENIRELLNSTKEESELTMCTDVDRNDKSRVCEPGSVRVIGRRLIESYAGLFHTVDHVEGTLAAGFDSLDAFLTHMWAVTIIGAPKKWAAQAIEILEKDARGWYGGAIGMISLDGDINTGITIRTIHLRDGIAKYAAGATSALRFRFPPPRKPKHASRPRASSARSTPLRRSLDSVRPGFHRGRRRQHAAGR